MTLTFNRETYAIAVPIQMQYNVTSRGVGARQCRAPTGVPHVNDNCYSLLAKSQPKVIKTDEENEQAIALAQELSHRVNRTLEESALLDLLVTLIEKYQDEHYPIEESTAHSMLLHLIDAQSVKEPELVAILGSREVVSQVMSGKQEITQEMAKVLANFFHVDTSLFEN